MVIDLDDPEVAPAGVNIPMIGAGNAALALAEVYRQRISALYDRLQDEEERTEAIAVLRTLVDRVPSSPKRTSWP